MTSEGKILIIKLHGRRLSLLLKGSQILSARAQNDAAVAVGDIYIGKYRVSPKISTPLSLIWAINI